MTSDVILGLSGIRGRFAVGLLVDGRVVFAVEEDKLRRFRGPGVLHLDENVGSRALDLAVEQAPGGPAGVGRVAYVPPVDASPDAVVADTAMIGAFLQNRFGIAPPVTPVDHIDAHLAFERAVHLGTDHVLMVGRTRAVFSSGPGQPRSFDVLTGLVSGVERVGAFAGFPSARIHHLENMARLGEPRLAGSISEVLAAAGRGEAFEERLSEVAGFARRREGEPIDQRHYDFAASVCRALHEGIVDLLHSVPQQDRSGPLAVCGGVFQSWSLNDALAEACPESRILASFAPGNASGAIGGPLVLRGGPPVEPVGPFLGPEYSREDVKAVLDNSKVRYSLRSSRDAAELVASALAEGQMVGWFDGRCEFGYRALGARSVFANPANPYACENLSSYLKRRPSYFAYAVAMDSGNAEIAGVESPYLSRSVRIPEYFGDSRVRVQSVSKSGAPGLWRLLDEFRKKTGVRALLNTSLNYFDEPIACTPRDALKTFYASGLDVLAMEDFILAKDEQTLSNF